MSIDPPAFALANNMSYINALHALSEHAQSLENAKSLEKPKSEGLMDTPDKVVDFLKKQNHLYVHHFDGQFIGVGFRYFPYLITVGYDTYHGTGTAQRALEKYSKIPTDRRFDKNDSCRFSDLTTVGYDMYHGTGAAQRTLEEYSKIPTDKRFDKNDSCRFSDITMPVAKL